MIRVGRVGGLVLAAIVLLVAPGSSQAGILDPTFGGSGYALSTPTINSGSQVATAPNGDVFLVANYASGQDEYFGTFAKLFRISSDGRSVSLLSSTHHARAADVAVEPDGKVIVAGTAYGHDQESGDVPMGIQVWSYLPDGSPDLSFGDGGTVVIPRDGSAIRTGLGDNGLDLAPDGRILVAGANSVAELGPDGSVEESYTAPNDWDIVAIASNKHGGAIVGGAILTSPNQDIGQTDDWLIRRLTPSLQPDPAFTPPVVGPGSYYPSRDGYASDLVVQPDGRVIVLGARGSDRAPMVVRLTQDGSLDSTFSYTQPAGVELAFPQSLTLEAQQRILLGGPGVAQRLDQGGSPDSSFGLGGLTSAWPPANHISWVHSDVAAEPDGRVVVSFAGPDGEICCPDSPPIFSAGVARFIAGDAAATEVRCRGLRATIVGTDAADHLRGTKGRDVIAGLSGNDQILGLARGDVVCGGPGNDLLLGGPGHDRLFGGPGADHLDGGHGRDLLRGGKGRNRLSS